MIPSKLLVAIISLIVAAGSFAVFYSGGYQTAGQPLSTTPSSLEGTVWNGTVTILTDGTISDLSAPIAQDGNVYTLTGNINGSLTVERTGATLLGAGYTVYNTVGTSPVTLTTANSITLSGLNVSSYWTSAINVVLSTNDTITGNNVTAMNAGIFVNSPYNSITGNRVIMNLTDPGFSGLREGIITHASNTVIEGNNVTSPYASIGILVDGQYSTATGNSVNVSGDYSIAVDTDGTSNLISDNILSSSGSYATGIALKTGSQENTVDYNRISVNGNWTYGITVIDGLNTISHNSVNLSGYSSAAISVSASGTGEDRVAGNYLNVTGANSYGIYVNGYNTTVSGNTISIVGNSTYGINTQVLGDILNNVVYANGTKAYGIYTYQNDRLIGGNTVNVSGYASFGIYLDSDSYITVSHNSIMSNGSRTNATHLYGNGMTFEMNSVTTGTDSGTAVYLQKYSSDNLIANNSISYSYIGLWTSTGSGNVFAGNSMVNDTVLFRLTSSNTNLFYHNSFVNYSSYIISPSTLSTFDNGYPSGGNYWYTYTGADAYSGPYQNITGSDGIGDTAFTVYGSIVDQYPLMQNWTIPTVTFTESNLAAGTEWSVTFDGVSTTSTVSSISFPILDAAYSTYSYSVAQVDGYDLAVPSGDVAYNGSSIAVSVVFSVIVPPPPPPPEEFTVTFSETGLPDGTSWSATLNGVTQTQSSASISFDIVNGTYSYTVGGVSGYSPEVGSGTVTVSGSGQTVNVEFSQVLYTVMFKNVGLPAGTTWYVNITNGQSYVSSASSVVFQLPNGTYEFNVSDVTGYNISGDTGTVSVSGNSPDPVTVTYTAQNGNTTPDITPSQPNGLGFWIYVIIGVVVGAAGTAIGLALYYRRR